MEKETKKPEPMTTTGCVVAILQLIVACAAIYYGAKVFLKF